MAGGLKEERGGGKDSGAGVAEGWRTHEGDQGPGDGGGTVGLNLLRTCLSLFHCSAATTEIPQTERLRQ